MDVTLTGNETHQVSCFITRREGRSDRSTKTTENNSSTATRPHIRYVGNLSSELPYTHLYCIYLAMMAWETDSVTSLYTTEPTLIAAALLPLPPPSNPPTRTMTVNGDLATGNHKATFKRHFQQPDEACAPPVMPKRRVAMTENKSERRRENRSPPSSQTRSSKNELRYPEPKPLSPTVPHTASAATLRSQPRVDRYKSLMTVQSAFSPISAPTPQYYATTTQTTMPTRHPKHQHNDADPALTPRCTTPEK